MDSFVISGPQLHDQWLNAIAHLASQLRIVPFGQYPCAKNDIFQECHVSNIFKSLWSYRNRSYVGNLIFFQVNGAISCSTNDIARTRKAQIEVVRDYRQTIAHLGIAEA